ncbi:MAG: SDR family NAD(P)-dependent oxidoreductase [Sandaracinaceae bacterium]|nr:SDR family NAD(P)-dependent oxidoreductase [Sandaracinaceae bacterium]
MSDLASKYGPYALILGGTAGIGAGFSAALARAGVSPLVVARAADAPGEFAQRLAAETGCDARGFALDLADDDAIAEVAELTAELDVGLVVYVAAVSLVGPFESHSAEAKRRALSVNCRGPLETCDVFLPRLRARGRGGLILMSSASGHQGTGWVSTYAATKAFNTVLAEGLWWEYREQGVDVLAVEAGRTETPTYRGQRPRDTATWIAPIQSADAVASEALAALGRVPSHLTGTRGRWSTRLMRTLLPRRTLVALYGSSTRAMFEPE